MWSIPGIGSEGIADMGGAKRARQLAGRLDHDFRCPEDCDDHGNCKAPRRTAITINADRSTSRIAAWRLSQITLRDCCLLRCPAFFFTFFDVSLFAVRRKWMRPIRSL